MAKHTAILLVWRSPAGSYGRASKCYCKIHVLFPPLFTSSGITGIVVHKCLLSPLLPSEDYSSPSWALWLVSSHHGGCVLSHLDVGLAHVFHFVKWMLSDIIRAEAWTAFAKLGLHACALTFHREENMLGVAILKGWNTPGTTWTQPEA